jgi:hypothetical protein
MGRIVRWKIIALVLLSGGLTVLLLPNRVDANAGPPPNVLWFHFAAQETTPTREGVQLVRCDNQTCSQPKLVRQVGVCDAPPCVTETETVTRTTTLECRANRCMALYGYGGFEHKEFLRLIVQYPDQVRLSNVFTLSHESDDQYEETLQVRITNGALRVAPGPSDSERNRPWLPAWGLTLVVEVAVAALVLWRLGLVRRELTILLSLIGVLNLLSFPVVWVFFPALGFFHTNLDVVFGTAILLVALLYGGVVGGIRWIDTIGRRLLLVGVAVGLLPIILIGTIFFAVFFGYGYQLPIAYGLPAHITLLLSELFAFIFEAVLIYLASRRALRIGQAALLSLAMNTASFLAGVLLWPAPGIWLLW